MRRFDLMLVLVVLAVVAAGCSRGDEVTATTATPDPVEQSVDDPDDSDETPTVGDTPEETDDSDTDTETTGEVVAGLPTYTVVGESGLGGIETLIVVVEPGNYSQVELENLVFDIVDRFSPGALMVVDSQDVADLLAEPELSDADEMTIAQHSVLRVDDGVDVTFLGKYADIPGLTIGS